MYIYIHTYIYIFHLYDLYQSMSIYVNLCQSMSTYVYLCLSMSIYVYLCLSMSIYVYLCLCFNMSKPTLVPRFYTSRFSISIHIYPFTYLSTYLSSYLSIDLSIQSNPTQSTLILSYPILSYLIWPYPIYLFECVCVFPSSICSICMCIHNI